MNDKNSKVIPEGKFCYRVESSIVSLPHPSASEVGQQTREAEFGEGTKMVLCPYWMRTKHGTVRCEYLDIEVEGMAEGDYGRAIEHYGVHQAAEIEWSLLSDKIKVCGVGRESK